MIAGVWVSSNPEFSADIRGGAYADLPWHTLVDTLDPRSGDEDVIAYHRPDNAWAIERIFDYYLDDVAGRRSILELLPGRDDNNEFLREAEIFIGEAPHERHRRMRMRVDEPRDEDVVRQLEALVGRKAAFRFDRGNKRFDAPIAHRDCVALEDAAGGLDCGATEVPRRCRKVQCNR